IYDPTVCIPGAPTATMAPLIVELEELLGAAASAVGRGTADEITALWGMVHGLGTLAAAGHFTLAQALSAWDSTVASS
ncbi:TetR/AcrR family transcriptional regulator, partial [Microbacterium keratanolyticum]